MLIVELPTSLSVALSDRPFNPAVFRVSLPVAAFRKKASAAAKPKFYFLRKQSFPLSISSGRRRTRIGVLTRIKSEQARSMASSRQIDKIDIKPERDFEIEAKAVAILHQDRLRFYLQRR